MGIDVNKDKLDVAVVPGEMLLREFLEPMGITQVELARHLGWPYARLNDKQNRRSCASRSLTPLEK